MIAARRLAQQGKPGRSSVLSLNYVCIPGLGVITESYDGSGNWKSSLLLIFAF
jgi:hypothetical protein